MLVPTGVQKPVKPNEAGQAGIGEFARAIVEAKNQFHEKFGEDAEPTHIMLSNKLAEEEIATLCQQFNLVEMTNDPQDVSQKKPHRYGMRVVWVGHYALQERELADDTWVDIKSANLHSIKWTPVEGGTGKLSARFKSDPSVVYTYDEPRETFIKLCHVPSAGSWFDQNVRGKTFVKTPQAGDPAKTHMDESAADDGPGSVVLFVDEFLAEAGDEAGAFKIALERGRLMLEMELTPPTHVGLPNPGTPIEIRTWATNEGGVFDYNDPSGRKAIWIRSLPDKGGAPAQQ